MPALFDRPITDVRKERLAPVSAHLGEMAFLYLVSGERGVFNLTANKAALGIEVRGLPHDSLHGLAELLQSLAHAEGLELELLSCEEGIRCDPANPFAQLLLQAVRATSGQKPVLGRKLHATTARFAPNGQGIVRQLSGLAPRAAGGSHYLPSILHYFRVLTRFGEMAATARGASLSSSIEREETLCRMQWESPAVTG